MRKSATGVFTLGLYSLLLGTIVQSAAAQNNTDFGGEFAPPAEAALPEASQKARLGAEGFEQNLPSAETYKPRSTQLNHSGSHQSGSHQSHSAQSLDAYQVAEGGEASYQNSCAQENTQLRQRLGELELSLHRSSESHSPSSQQGVLLSGDARVNALQEELSRKINREQELANQIARLIKENSALEQSLISAEKGEAGHSSAFYNSPRARFEKQAAQDYISDFELTKRTTPSEAYEAGGFDRRSINTARDEFYEKMLVINSLISERDSIYKLNPAADRNDITPKLLETNEKVSYLNLKDQIQNLASSSDLQGIRRGLSQIENILKDDIELSHRIN